MCVSNNTVITAACKSESQSLGFSDMRCHHSQAYQCQVCGAIFDSAFAASEHVKEQHFFPEL
ncbi:hypothetical protein GGI15_002647 [Coemansia interrupta]|uniref:C2H2-type domain-containing protein n=1 Tax=Coemansia interrupta TaxID=1126814 RepID=A0A9W8LKU3_9FUNG|nr:hypothetical protein GGI15_002647 [Coemansia interrupta]